MSSFKHAILLMVSVAAPDAFRLYLGFSDCSLEVRPVL